MDEDHEAYHLIRQTLNPPQPRDPQPSNTLRPQKQANRRTLVLPHFPTLLLADHSHSRRTTVEILQTNRSFEPQSHAEALDLSEMEKPRNTSAPARWLPRDEIMFHRIAHGLKLKNSGIVKSPERRLQPPANNTPVTWFEERTIILNMSRKLLILLEQNQPSCWTPPNSLIVAVAVRQITFALLRRASYHHVRPGEGRLRQGGRSSGEPLPRPMDSVASLASTRPFNTWLDPEHHHCKCYVLRIRIYHPTIVF